MTRPVVRVEHTLIWPDGFARPATRWERLVLWLRLPLKVKPPTEVQRQLHRFVAVQAFPLCPETDLPCLSPNCKAVGCRALPSDDNDDNEERR